MQPAVLHFSITFFPNKPECFDITGKTEKFWLSQITSLKKASGTKKQVFHFCTPWKNKKNIAFLMFSGDIDMEHWLKMG